METHQCLFLPLLFVIKRTCPNHQRDYTSGTSRGRRRSKSSPVSSLIQCTSRSQPYVSLYTSYTNRISSFTFSFPDRFFCRLGMKRDRSSFFYGTKNLRERKLSEIGISIEVIIAESSGAMQSIAMCARACGLSAPLSRRLMSSLR